MSRKSVSTLERAAMEMSLKFVYRLFSSLSKNTLWDLRTIGSLSVSGVDFLLSIVNFSADVTSQEGLLC